MSTRKRITMQDKKRSIGLAVLLVICSTALLMTGTRAGAQLTEQVLYGGFDTTSPDAFEPTGGVIFDGPSHLFGTTLDGGTHDFGTVYELEEASGIWSEAVVYSFGGSTDGSGLSYGVVLYNGDLYGTTQSGGKYGYGTVFELSPPTATVHHWTKTILHAFGASTTDGQYPSAGLALGPAGTLYGTTSKGGTNTTCSNGSGGSSACGTVFELKANTNGSWSCKTIYSFGSSSITDDGQTPVGVVYYKGNLYGTTEDGGSYGEGTVFELSPASGVWAEPGTTPLHAFTGYPNDGAIPGVGLTVDISGNLWGTTSQGGVNLNDGTVYELKLVSGVWTYGDNGLPNYSLTGTYGTYPSRVAFDVYGNIWLTTEEGGPGQGEALELTFNGTAWGPGASWAFGGAGDGAFPSSGLTSDSNGNFYGTTQEGGTFGWGAVFEITP
ncbi:MAG: choice-of-anchor tandem repeat GloVer-containing protein [Candidatus Sulfotelmatobacter sp.]